MPTIAHATAPWQVWKLRHDTHVRRVPRGTERFTCSPRESLQSLLRFTTRIVERLWRQPVGNAQQVEVQRAGDARGRGPTELPGVPLCTGNIWVTAELPSWP